MTIRDEIIIQEAKRPGLEITIPEAEGDDILTLRLKGRLTPTIASVLECDYLYTEQGSPHDGFKETTLAITLADMDLKLIGGDGKEVNNFFPERIFGFRIYRSGDTTLNVQFKARTTGRLQEILDFFRANRGDGFTISIKPRQGDLFDGGTRVALSEGTTGDPMNEVVANTLEGIAEATEKAGMLLPTTDEPTAAELVNPTEPPLAPRPRRRKGKVHGDTQPAIEEPAGEAPPWEDDPEAA